MDWVADNLLAWLDEATDAELDEMPYGVVGFDAEGKTCRYSAYESRLSGLKQEQVLGRHFFEEIGRCMNNRMVARRFDSAQASNVALDCVIDYVLAFRSQLTPVKLRLLSQPGAPMRYLLVQRQQRADA